MIIHYIIDRFREKKAEIMDDTDDACKRSSIDNKVWLFHFFSTRDENMHEFDCAVE